MSKAGASQVLKTAKTAKLALLCLPLRLHPHTHHHHRPPLQHEASLQFSRQF